MKLPPLPIFSCHSLEASLHCVSVKDRLGHRGGGFFVDLNVSPYRTHFTRPVTSGLCPNITTRTSRAQTTLAHFGALPGIARTGRQEIRGVGDVRQVAGTRVTTTPHSPPTAELCCGGAWHPRARIGRWVPRILCSEHNYLVGDWGSLSFGSMKEMLLIAREAKGSGQAPWHPALPMSPSPGEHITVRSTLHLSGYPAASAVAFLHPEHPIR